MADNVKVAVRVRPFNSREITRKAVLVIKMTGNTTEITDPAEPNAEPKKFTFDFSYWSHDGFQEMPDGYLEPKTRDYADQKKVFADLGEGVLANAWLGYNCSLFAYGQTGSGKSYSMVGYGANKGIVPITCEKLFEGIEAKKKEGSPIEYQVALSMLEIYNEQVRDLLNLASLKIKGGLKVRQHPKLGFYVETLTKVPVNNYADINAKIEQGTKNRTVASTNMNATSSRAHTIVAVTFSQRGKNEKTGQDTTKTSIINLVDLAGSERAESTGATGDRLKEGSAINKSLSTLGNCIKALADQSTGKKNVLVPFRDSMLTKLLKNALGGNSKTVMIAALSPADINFEETLSTLRFADRAKAIKTKAVINESPTDKLIRELREENERLMKALEGKPIDGATPAEPQIIEKNVGYSEQEVEEMKKQMEERLKKNQQEMQQMKQTWAETLKEQEKKTKEEQKQRHKEIEMRKTTAHFWNLNEDPQLTNMVVHFIKKGSNRIGNKKAQPQPEIILNGLSIQQEHCSVDLQKTTIKLKPAPNSKIVVNGIKVVDETTLHHNDRILFGSNHLYVLHHPTDPELLAKQKAAKAAGKEFHDDAPTYESAQEEITKNSSFFGNLATDTKDTKDDLLLQEDLLKILPMIAEANAMSEELNKKVGFEPVLISPQARGLKEGRTEVKVKLNDLTNDNEWVWDKNKFMNRKFIMQEMYQNMLEGEDWDVEQDQDPFWEPVDTDVLIGSVHVYMQSLAFKIELEENLAISNYKGKESGHLQVEIAPCKSSGSPLEEDDFVEDPNELIGSNLHFKVRILNARGLPQKFGKGETYCKYKVYLDQNPTSTNVVKGTINPDYKHEKMYSFTPVTRQSVDYLSNQPLIVEVWGKQSGDSTGRRVSMSTKQLMDNSFSRSGTLASIRDDDERYKLLCDLGTYRRRTERLNRKLKRIQELVDKAKEAKEKNVEVDKLDQILTGSDKSDLIRFKAAAAVILTTENAKKQNDGKVTSTACSIQ